ncbi:hypothetical protein GGI1_11368 [Acidithiobacillus sp. GGI-221]|nr:hypothetical protein GGI1_11368 [Acidithiobacillus sp. GGI-221]
MMVDKVTATEATLELIEFLKKNNGNELMFHQSGGATTALPTVTSLANSPLVLATNTSELLVDVPFT